MNLASSNEELSVDRSKWLQVNSDFISGDYRY